MNIVWSLNYAETQSHELRMKNNLKTSMVHENKKTSKYHES